MGNLVTFPPTQLHPLWFPLWEPFVFKAQKSWKKIQNKLLPEVRADVHKNIFDKKSFFFIPKDWICLSLPFLLSPFGQENCPIALHLNFNKIITEWSKDRKSHNRGCHSTSTCQSFFSWHLCNWFCLIGGDTSISYSLWQQNHKLILATKSGLLAIFFANYEANQIDSITYK